MQSRYRLYWVGRIKVSFSGQLYMHFRVSWRILEVEFQRPLQRSRPFSSQLARCSDSPGGGASVWKWEQMLLWAEWRMSVHVFTFRFQQRIQKSNAFVSFPITNPIWKSFWIIFSCFSELCFIRVKAAAFFPLIVPCRQENIVGVEASRAVAN